MDAAGDAFDEVFGAADAHEVAGAVGGKLGEGDVAGGPHGGFGFADGEAADGEAGGIELDGFAGVVATEAGVGAALDDGEGGELGCCLATAAVPAEGALDGFGGGGEGGVAGEDVVEGHGDVDAEGGLDLHGELGGVVVFGAVDVGAEADAFFADVAEAGEGEDLESTAIGEDWAGPLHEAVDAAEVLDELVAGSEVEVVGVDEDDAGAGGGDFGGEEGFDSGEGADGHEDGGLEAAAGGGDAPGARGDGAGGLGGELEVEGGRGVVHGWVMAAMAWCTRGSGTPWRTVAWPRRSRRTQRMAPARTFLSTRVAS